MERGDSDSIGSHGHGNDSDSIESHGHGNDVLKEPLIAKEETLVFGDKQDEVKCSGVVVWEEVKKQCWIAGPMVAVNLLQYSLQVISVMLVGHLGELALSSASIATSFAGVSGFSVLILSMVDAVYSCVGNLQLILLLPTHHKTYGTGGHPCDCNIVFSRVERFIEHQDDCIVAEEKASFRYNHFSS